MKNKLLLVGGLLILLYLSPLLIFGQTSLVTIHDILDGVTHKILAESGQIFAANDTVIPNLLNGVPRSVLGSEFNIQVWLVYLFGSFSALVLNEIFIHSIAFVGMYRLLRRHFVPKKNHLVIIGTSTAFALLPFFTILGLTGASQALALDAFLTIRRGGSKWIDWLVIALLPLYTQISHAYLFFLILMVAIWLYDLIVKKQPNGYFLGAITLMAIVYLLVEYRIIFAMFLDSNFISHRTEFRIEPNGALLYSLYLAILKAGHVFFIGHENAKSLHTIFILPVTVIGLFILFDRDIKDKRIPVLLLVLIVLSSLHGILRMPDWSMKDQVKFLAVFRFDRFFYLNPLLWHIIFALSLNLISTQVKKGNKVVSVFLCLQLLLTFFHHDEIQMRNNKPTYQEFFSEKLFKDIDNYIGRDKKEYRVVSIGMHPSIAQYNGFNTVDGYIGSYPLKHKHMFRKVISKELEKDEALRRYFDWSGGRCYIFSAELKLGDWLYTKNRAVSISNLQLNTSQMVKMGGEYIFSAVEIKNNKENKLELLNIFENESAGWKIYLYQPEEILS